MKGRFALPIAWSLGAVALIGLEAIPAAILNMGAPADGWRAANFVVAHGHYVLSLVAACVIFALVYALMRPSNWRRRLAWLQTALFFAGAAPIFGPIWLEVFVVGSRRPMDLMEATLWLERLSAFGWVVSFVALLIFIGLTVDAAFRAVARRSRSSS